MKRKLQYPPVQEKQHKACGKSRPYPAPSDFLTFHALGPQTRECQQKDSKQLRVKDGTEQSGGTIEIHQYPVRHADVDTPEAYGLIAEPIDIHDH